MNGDRKSNVIATNLKDFDHIIMADETTKLKSVLSTLHSSLDELEAHLEPLFAQALPELVVKLDTIQQAKLHVVLPYLIYDLLFIYLKSRGIDPKTHAVVSELDRIRQYFEKIAGAESPAKKRLEIDKAAANRFIKNAITQVKTINPSSGPDPPVAGPSTDVRVPIKVTSKMLERAKYEKELSIADAEDVEEEVLQVWESVPDDDDDDEVMEDVQAKEVNAGTERNAKNEDVAWRRKRPVIDPFTGQVENTDPSTSHHASASDPKSGARVAKKAKKK